MNIKNWSKGKKLAALLLSLLAIVGLALTIFLVQRQQELRGRAEKATVLSLAPPNQSVAPGGEANLDLVVNPGTNQVSVVGFTIKFDADRFSADQNSFALEEGLNLSISDGPVAGNGEFSISVSVGSDPTKAISTTQKIGSIKLQVKESALGGSSQITFDESTTQVRSVGAGDSFSENVLSSTVPATVTIIAVCTPNIGTCEWVQIPDVDDSAITRYNFKVTDEKTGEVVKEGVSQTTKSCSSNFPDFEGCQAVEFPSEPGKTYKCEVSAVNECGTGEPGEATSTCPVPSATPTPGPTSSPTPTSAPGTSATATPTPTTPVSTATPTPTTAVGEDSEPTPTTPPQGGVETPTPTQASEEVGQQTPIPTLPPPGSPVVTFGIVGGILFILGGIVLLFL